LDTSLLLGKPRLLIMAGPNSTFGYGRPRYDVSRDGKRFLLVRRGRSSNPVHEFVAVLNWSTVLQQLSGAQ
jgi:hypothetical protein